VTEVAVVHTWNDEPGHPPVTDVRMFADDAECFEHGRLPSLVWNEEQGWRNNDRPSRFVSALRNALRRA
jgi:hypothetical protein